jgi:large subunit ribosomal protein L30
VAEAAKRKGAKKKKKATTATKRPAPKRTKAKSTSAAKLRVRQVRSGIGHAYPFRRTLTALGLKHHQDEVVVIDNPSVRGMIYKVRHLVHVTEEA